MKKEEANFKKRKKN